jgi:CRP-like cAMP-binding protein/Fe-S-cluster-containing dehydrogenase component
MSTDITQGDVNYEDDFEYFGEENLFSRDVVDDQLIRFEKATAKQFKEMVPIVLDGVSFQVPKAVPLADAQGNHINDEEGNPIPRMTTIFDAMNSYCREYNKRKEEEAFSQSMATGVGPGRSTGLGRSGKVSPDELLTNPIPVLCHQEHMQPVGVCRMCLVQIEQTKKGRSVTQLVPACTRRVEAGMTIHTPRTPNDKVAAELKAKTGVLAELLTVDHGEYRDGVRDAECRTELDELTRKLLDGKPSRFPTNPAPRGRDDTSSVIAVDHSACILCDRCKRACSEVKQNFVIGRSGKGYLSKIGFDLDTAMGDSSCVSCGECMVSCPTEALSFRDRVRNIAPVKKGTDTDIPTFDEIRAVPLFKALPQKFLEWNTGAIKKKTLKKGDVLCKEGDFGSTAYVIISGRFDIHKTMSAGGEATAAKKGGLLGWFSRPTIPAKATGGVLKHLGVRDANDLILGEMTCLNNYPRSATITAIEECKVFEINRNILHYLQRNPESRALLNRVYNVRALQNQLNQIEFFKGLGEGPKKAATDLLAEKIKIVHIDPGQIIFREGDPAEDIYIVRLGYVKIGKRQPGQPEVVLDYFGPDKQIGEVGVLTGKVFEKSNVDHCRNLHDELCKRVPEAIRGVRTATCSALDHVELVRIDARDFHELVEKVPELADSLFQYVRKLLRMNARGGAGQGLPLNHFLDQGLYHGQKLLILDLESCTRCDECTRACADTHGGETRLVRDGLRFDRFLVASACRSCKDPYCLVGCPVDAIHRRSDSKTPGALEIIIENHCIGCGLCANNCPYGNISMQPRPKGDGSTAARTAAMCDLCSSIGIQPNEDPSCVWACPHHAAFRATGDDLRKIAQGSESRVEDRFTLDDLLHR